MRQQVPDSSSIALLPNRSTPPSGVTVLLLPTRAPELISSSLDCGVPDVSALLPTRAGSRPAKRRYCWRDRSIASMSCATPLSTARDCVDVANNAITKSRLIPHLDPSRERLLVWRGKNSTPLQANDAFSEIPSPLANALFSNRFTRARQAKLEKLQIVGRFGTAPLSGSGLPDQVRPPVTQLRVHLYRHRMPPEQVSGVVPIVDCH